MGLGKKYYLVCRIRDIVTEVLFSVLVMML